MAQNTLQQNVVPNEPHLIDLLNLFKKQILLEFNAHHIGTIQSFNPSNQTAFVTINYVKTFFQFNEDTGIYESNTVDYPVVTEAPVICLGGGAASLTFPIAAGDECLVLFNDRDLDNWFTGGTGSPNATARLHSFSDALVLVGLRSLSHSLANYDTTRAVLKNGQASIGVGPTLIKIANNATTLNTLFQSLITNLQNLCTALEALTVTCASPGSPSSPPINAASIAAVSTQLTTLGTQIGGLLQ